MTELISSIITIDGPTASGKGTLSRLLAKKLGWHFLDSGVIYRALAFAVLQYPNTNLDDANTLQKLIEMLKAECPLNDKTDGFDCHVIFQGIDVSDKIRTGICSNMASELAALPLVRQNLLAWQRQFYRLPGLVADGRDMGTIVFPNAKLKVFLSGSVEKRAERRFKQLKEKGIDATLEAVLKDLLVRDKRDTERSVAPLKPADDAVIIDTTKLSIDQVLQKIIRCLQ